MDPRTPPAPRKATKSREAAAPVGPDAGAVGLPVVDPGRAKGPEGSAPEPETAKRPPTVAGKPVRELAALIIPAVFLVTEGDGTHEITRCYYLKGKYTIAAGERSRLGPFEVLGADLGADGRLTLTFSQGYVVTAPADRIQATHRV